MVQYRGYCPVEIYKKNNKRYLYFPGVDFGPCLHRIEVENEKYYFVYISGGTCYLYRSEYVYSKPAYSIFEKVKPEGSDKFAVADWSGIEFEYTRETKKEVYKKAFDKFEELMFKKEAA